MDRPALLTPFHPALLPLGTAIGDWRVLDWTGCGVFGAVYRAVPVLDPQAAPMALKLALRPADPRFAREAELLSRCHHPSIPRLLDQGSWLSPAGTHHPFLVMQWIDGVALYEQDRLHNAPPAQLRRWLLQLAQALAVVHAQAAVHRDLKGDNILISRSDGRAMLMDFGTGLYPGAASLTPPMGFPGTPLYRSPQSWLFELRFHGNSTALYRPSPADDLYALGVTTCRLLTGEYPRLAAPSQDEHGTLHPQGVLLPRALVRHHHIDPTLRALTLRLLSVNPEQRGTAAQLARELEPTLEPFRPSPFRDASTSARTPLLPRHARRRGWALAAGLALLIAAWWALPGKSWQEHSIARAEATKAHPAKVGTAGLGDAATASAMEKPPAVSSAEALSEDSPPEPVPGQVRPDPKGRCPGKGPVSLNGGCWWEAKGEPESCQELEGQMFKGTCYVPVITHGRKRPPTSVPMKTP